MEFNTKRRKLGKSCIPVYVIKDSKSYTLEVDSRINSLFQLDRVVMSF